MIRQLLLGILRRPHQAVGLLLSLVALFAKLKQLTEVTRPNGWPLPGYEDQAYWLGVQVAMEFHQVQERAGVDHGNPGWTECGHCLGMGLGPDMHTCPECYGDGVVPEAF